MPKEFYFCTFETLLQIEAQSSDQMLFTTENDSSNKYLFGL